MLQKLECHNDLDIHKRPAGGFVKGKGLAVSWQNGPLGRGENRQPSNGAFVEDLIEASRQRIEFYQTAQDGKFACKENEKAIGHLEKALAVLNDRTERREKEGKEGTHEV